MAAPGADPETDVGASKDKGTADLLASSSFATCSDVNRHPSAPRFCISCSSLRAPMTRVETVGLRSSQLSDQCPHVLVERERHELILVVTAHQRVVFFSTVVQQPTGN